MIDSSVRSMSLGLLGAGTMGAPMALNVRRALPEGADVLVTARSRERVEHLLDEGLTWVASPRELADRAAVVLVMLPDLPQLEPLLGGEDGLLAGALPLVIAIGSTVLPPAVRALAERVDEATGGRVAVIDCPVSGGEEGARAATLSIMVGGEEAAVRTAEPFLAAMGRPVRLGPIGAGSVAKACNQLIVGATVLALAEAAVLAERSGIALDVLFDLLAGGYAGSRVLETRKRRFIEHDHAPSGAAKYMAKDLGFAEALAVSTETAAVQLPVTRSAFDELVAAGFGDQDLAAAQAFIERR